MPQIVFSIGFARTVASALLALALAGSPLACAQSGHQGVARASGDPQTAAQTPTPRGEIGKRTTGGIGGNRTVEGTVEEISGDQIKVDTGEVQPRYLPLDMAEEKGFEVREGDRLVITLSDQNLVVDYHPVGDKPVHHVLHGRLITPLTIGHDNAVIRTEDGREQGFEVRPLARSKVAAIPIGVPAVFLIDETGQIADATFGSPEAVEQAKQEWAKRSPIKGAHQRVVGTVLKPLAENQITIRTEDGRQRPFDVREIAQDKLSKVEEGQRVILMIDNEEQVVDVAVPPRRSRG